jgi:hypothetical protein
MSAGISSARGESSIAPGTTAVNGNRDSRGSSTHECVQPYEDHHSLGFGHVVARRLGAGSRRPAAKRLRPAIGRAGRRCAAAELAQGSAAAAGGTARATARWPASRRRSWSCRSRPSRSWPAQCRRSAARTKLRQGSRTGARLGRTRLSRQCRLGWRTLAP